MAPQTFCFLVVWEEGQEELGKRPREAEASFSPGSECVRPGFSSLKLGQLYLSIVECISHCLTLIFLFEICFWVTLMLPEVDETSKRERDEIFFAALTSILNRSCNRNIEVSQ